MNNMHDMNMTGLGRVNNGIIGSLHLLKVSNEEKNEVINLQRAPLQAICFKEGTQQSLRRTF